MPILQVAFKQAIPKVALVQAQGTAIPAGYLKAGEFDHPDPVYPGSLVIYQGVRDLLYHFNQLDMQSVSIELADGLVVAYVTQIDVPWGGWDLRINDPLYNKAPMNASAWPPGAANTSLTYASSDPSVVTVSADGVLTAVSEGSSTITITAPGSAGTAKLKKEIVVTVGGKRN